MIEEKKIDLLKELVNIKRDNLGIQAKIHEICTCIAEKHLSCSIFGDNDYEKLFFNPKTSPGYDILVKGVTSDNKTCKYHAEVKANFSFSEGDEGDKLHDDAVKLKNSGADKKYIVVLFSELEEKVKGRFRRRKIDPKIDLCAEGIEVISIERILKQKL